MHKVEAFLENVWTKISNHKHFDNAIAVGEVTALSKRCPVRIVYEGKIIWTEEKI
jgi:hypothetical protein